jgi:exopolyphosphatase/guanosine-5'-triphosphate,3'-diphosphate pyrophosphatase
MLRFASIDIGSNAIRLLLCNVFEVSKTETIFKKSSLVRIPLRLGEDSFLKHEISEEKIEKLVQTMQAFKYLIRVHDVIAYRACATSAMREASNSKEILSRVKKESGINIEIIDGKTEAEIICSNSLSQKLHPEKSYLYIDVGGGSTELTLFSNNKMVASRSFNIGTLRILHGQIHEADWLLLKKWLKETVKNHPHIQAIGSGGNINKLYSMTRKKDSKRIDQAKLRHIYLFLKKHSYLERINKLGLNPDRADVILPACEIFLFIMKNAGVKKMMVPEIGVSDGIVHLLYKNYKKAAKA